MLPEGWKLQVSSRLDVLANITQPLDIHPWSNVDLNRRKLDAHDLHPHLSVTIIHFLGMLVTDNFINEPHAVDKILHLLFLRYVRGRWPFSYYSHEETWLWTFGTTCFVFSPLCETNYILSVQSEVLLEANRPQSSYNIAIEDRNFEQELTDVLKKPVIRWTALKADLQMSRECTHPLKTHLSQNFWWLSATSKW